MRLRKNYSEHMQMTSWKICANVGLIDSTRDFFEFSTMSSVWR